MKQKLFFYKNIAQEVEESGYNEDKIKFILTHLGSRLKVLDVGCNDGFIGSLLMKKNNEVHGVDVAKHKVMEARKKGIKAITFDIESKPFPYPGNYFDAVVLTDVIEHVFDTDCLLGNIYRILKKNGILLITTPNVASLGRRIMLLFGLSPFLEHSTRHMRLLPPVGHIRYYTHTNLKSQLYINRFRNIMIKGDRVNFYLFSSVLAAKIFPSLSVDILCQCIK